eukprot:5819681-Alexandrium_andersonii.AAC.1
MSASLVGSEMCIRDSHNHLPCNYHWLSCLPRTRIWDGLELRAARYDSGCLLYTSDAADDM